VFGVRQTITSGCLVQFLVKGSPDCSGRYIQVSPDLGSKIDGDEQATPKKLAENYSNEKYEIANALFFSCW